MTECPAFENMSRADLIAEAARLWGHLHCLGSMPRLTAPRVVVESPYTGDVERNIAYARAALGDCLGRGEAPFASHLLYTQPDVLDDTDPTQRRRGIDAGFAWGVEADAVVVYRDLGISPGMLDGIIHYKTTGLPIVYRTLPGWGLNAGPQE